MAAARTSSSIRTLVFVLLVMSAALLAPATGFAQITGSIAGTIKDASGSVIPGVTSPSADRRCSAKG